MSDSEFKILKAIVREGYNRKAHHFNKVWRKALEDAEALVFEEKTKRNKLINNLKN